MKPINRATARPQPPTAYVYTDSFRLACRLAQATQTPQSRITREGEEIFRLEIDQKHITRSSRA